MVALFADVEEPKGLDASALFSSILYKDKEFSGI